MEEEQFLLVLLSNRSMRHFPNNTTSSFITELPHLIVLHGEWEVAISEIQFPCTFLHVRQNENVIRFVDVKPDEETNGPFTAKKLHFQMEFTTISTSLLRRLISRVKMPNRIFISNSKVRLAAKST